MNQDIGASNRFEKQFGDLGKVVEALRALKELGMRDVTVTTVSRVADGQVVTAYYVEAVELNRAAIRSAA